MMFADCGRKEDANTNLLLQRPLGEPAYFFSVFR